MYHFAPVSPKENLTDSKVLPIFVGFSFKIIYFIWVFILFNFVNPDTILSGRNVPFCLSFGNVKLLLLALASRASDVINMVKSSV